MARTPRILIAGEPAAYHVISRTALDGYPLGDVVKVYFVNLVKQFCQLYFAEVIGFWCMGNHSLLLVRMQSEAGVTDEAFKKRLVDFYGRDRVFGDGPLQTFRRKLASLFEYVREIKLRFTRFYNKRHGRRRGFPGESVQKHGGGKRGTLINCLSYIDLNPVRAGSVTRPEDYRWNSIGYQILSPNKDDSLSLDFGLREFGVLGSEERLRRYRRFLYETGAVDKTMGWLKKKGKTITG